MPPKTPKRALLFGAQEFLEQRKEGEATANGEYAQDVASVNQHLEDSTLTRLHALLDSMHDFTGSRNKHIDYHLIKHFLLNGQSLRSEQQSLDRWIESKFSHSSQAQIELKHMAQAFYRYLDTDSPLQLSGGLERNVLDFFIKLKGDDIVIYENEPSIGNTNADDIIKAFASVASVSSSTGGVQSVPTKLCVIDGSKYPEKTLCGVSLTRIVKTNATALDRDGQLIDNLPLLSDESATSCTYKQSDLACLTRERGELLYVHDMGVVGDSLKYRMSNNVQTVHFDKLREGPKKGVPTFSEMMAMYVAKPKSEIRRQLMERLYSNYGLEQPGIMLPNSINHRIGFLFDLKRSGDWLQVEASKRLHANANGTNNRVIFMSVDLSTIGRSISCGVPSIKTSSTGQKFSAISYTTNVNIQTATEIRNTALEVMRFMQIAIDDENSIDIPKALAALSDILVAFKMPAPGEPTRKRVRIESPDAANMIDKLAATAVKTYRAYSDAIKMEMFQKRLNNYEEAVPEQSEINSFHIDIDALYNRFMQNLHIAMIYLVHLATYLQLAETKTQLRADILNLKSVTDVLTSIVEPTTDPGVTLSHACSRVNQAIMSIRKTHNVDDLSLFAFRITENGISNFQEFVERIQANKMLLFSLSADIDQVVDFLQARIFGLLEMHDLFQVQELTSTVKSSARFSSKRIIFGKSKAQLKKDSEKYASRLGGKQTSVGTRMNDFIHKTLRRTIAMNNAIVESRKKRDSEKEVHYQNILRFDNYRVWLADDTERLTERCAFYLKAIKAQTQMPSQLGGMLSVRATPARPVQSAKLSTRALPVIRTTAALPAPPASARPLVRASVRPTARDAAPAPAPASARAYETPLRPTTSAQKSPKATLALHSESMNWTWMCSVEDHWKALPTSLLNNLIASTGSSLPLLPFPSPIMPIKWNPMCYDRIIESTTPETVPVIEIPLHKIDPLDFVTVSAITRVQNGVAYVSPEFYAFNKCMAYRSNKTYNSVEEYGTDGGVIRGGGKARKPRVKRQK